MLGSYTDLRQRIAAYAEPALSAITAPLLLRFFSPVAAVVLALLVALAAARPWTEGDATDAHAEISPHVLQHQALGAALEPLDAGELTAGVVRLVVALQPTHTPSPTSTPPPTATPEPVRVAPPPTSHPQTALPPPPVTSGCSGSLGGLALSLFNAMNAERTNRGMAPLAVSSCAVRVGKLRASDMARRGYFSHTSPEGQTAFSLLDSLGVDYGWAGENIARNSYPGAQTVTAAMQGFMASPGHRDNILSANFTHAGVGAAVDGAGVTYFSIVFISI